MTEETKATGSGGREHEGEEPVDRQQLVDLGSAVSGRSGGISTPSPSSARWRATSWPPDTAKTDQV